MEFKKNQSIYLQIADLICENILRKKWNEGEKIPSVREMAAEIEVNPNTVMRTYTHLQDQRIVDNKRGIGLFVAKGASGRIHSLQKKAFIKEELPALFKKMNLLEVSFQDLKNIYEKDPKRNK